MGMLLCLATTMHAQVDFTEVDLNPDGLGSGPNGVYYDMGDYNNDGFPDILTTGNYAGGMYMYTYDDAGINFLQQNIRSQIHRAKFGDFDNNDTLDVIMTEQTGTIRIRMNGGTDPDVTITPSVDDGTGLSMVGIVVLDFDNDGDDDFAIGEYEAGSSIYVFENNNMNFTLTDEIAGYGIGRHMSGYVGDMDGDGYDDIVWTTQTGAGLSISENMDGTGQFTPHVYSDAASGNGFHINLEDMDGDGDLDMVTQQYNSATTSYEVVVFVNNCTPGIFSFTKVAYPTITETFLRNVAVGNFTADTNPDIAYFDGGFGDSLVVMINVNMDFSSNVVFNTIAGHYTESLFAGDFNQDGYEDLTNDEFLMLNNLGSTENDWTISANAVQGAYSAAVDFGVKASASDGLDQTLDTPEPPGASGNNVRAWFAHPEYNGALGDNYIADIQGVIDFSDTSKVWTMNVLTTVAGSGSVAFDLPAAFELPVVITEGDNTWVTRGSDITVPFVSDGSTTLVYTIAVGDTTAPIIAPDAILEGPAIWNNEINRNLTWSVTEKNSYTSELSVSYDGGSSWNSLTSGSAAFDYDVPDSTLTYDVHFRISATDAALNERVFTSAFPITIVDPVQQVSFDTGWHMAGSPFAPVDNENSALAESFRFNWTGFKYEATEFYSTGGGHWLGTYNMVSDILTGTISESTVSVTEDAGWRIITPPLFTRTMVDSIHVTNTATSDKVLFSQAVDSGWVTMPYMYNEGIYTVTTEMMPFNAYWIGVLSSSAEFEFPVHTYASAVSKENGSNVIEMIVHDGNSEQNLKIGSAISRTTPLPPAAPNTSSSGLLGEETVLGKLYIELPAAPDAEQITSFGVNGPDRLITIKWESQTVNDNLRYMLVTSDGTELDLTKAGSYVWNTAGAAPEVITSPISTSNDVLPSELPTKVTLRQNYPNPFNPATSIQFSLPESQEVTLQVFNMLGQQVQTLVQGSMPAGNHTVSFNAENLASGVYLYRIQTAQTVITRQMVVIK